MAFKQLFVAIHQLLSSPLKDFSTKKVLEFLCRLKPLKHSENALCDVIEPRERQRHTCSTPLELSMLATPKLIIDKLVMQRREDR